MGTSMNAQVTIIIVTWNSENEIEACLSSLQNEVDKGIAHVIVVDNASTDRTVKLIRRQYPWCELIINVDNLGFAAANNVAICQLSTEYVLFLNPDTELFPGALSRMLQFMQLHPTVGVLGPRVYLDDDRVQPTILPYPSLVGSVFGFVRYLCTSSANIVPAYNADTHVLVDAVSGACMLVRQEALSQVKGMDERYFLAAEEVDLCYRIKKAGWEIVYYTGASIRHHGGRSMAKASLRSFVEKRRGRVLFMLQHRSRLEAQVEMYLIELLTLLRSVIHAENRQYYRDAVRLFRQRTRPLFRS